MTITTSILHYNLGFRIIRNSERDLAIYIPLPFNNELRIGVYGKGE